MQKDTATNFFSILFNGEHHIPGDIKEFGIGWCINVTYGSFSTYDYDYLTKLVIMSHKYAVRSEIVPSGPGKFKIAIWQRQREGGMSTRHPTIEQSLEKFNNLPESLKQKEVNNE